MRALLLVSLVMAASPAWSSERCTHHDALRNVYFGDLHVHTRFSQDASTQGTRTRPADAYRFARGAPIGVQPYDVEGLPLRTLQLARPLDFAAVTDHAEQLGETLVCNSPTLPGYESWVCRIYRRWPRMAYFMMNTRAAYSKTPARFDFCGENAVHCLTAAATAWRETIDAAEAADVGPPDCSFTAFIGYEWTAAPGSNNLHRNVIFASAETLELPVSYFEASTAETLWTSLNDQCLTRDDGCDAIIIPHNSNLSGGRMFESVDSQGRPIDAEYARARAAMEPLVEVLQHKGDSECVRSPTTTDEACDFEKLPYSNFQGKYVEMLRDPPEPASFVRDALKAGLAAEQELGANPFAVGMIASTDTHISAAGAVVESQFLGHGGAGVPARDAIPAGLPDNVEFNPGGLAAVWAEENSRDALFAALRRRETYATSGPRFRVRFFGGWRGPAAGCDAADGRAFAQAGYEAGVPMGGVLPSIPRDGSAPSFSLLALADPGEPGTASVPLDRIQIVKGWVDADGNAHEHVFDVAAADQVATIDPARCEPAQNGPRQLCAVWTDPDFDASAHAFYYARVLEAPTCRWSQLLCNAAGVRCGDAASVAEGFEACCQESHRPLIQERAITSPIWYTPAPR